MDAPADQGEPAADRAAAPRARERLAAMAGVSSGRVAVAAATVVLLRDRAADGAPELLMLRRNSRLAFAGGSWVFPGGRLDPEDYPGGQVSDEVEHLSAAEAAAAAREATEEAGLVIEPDAMHRWSHWTPPAGETKRFSTAFFVARAPEGDVVIDDGEIHEHQWVGAADALDLAARREIELLPPTFVTLLQLAAHTTVDAVLDRAATHPVEHFETRIARAGDELAALFFGDEHYDTPTDAVTASDGPRHRLWLRDGPWHYERTIGPTPWVR